MLSPPQMISLATTLARKNKVNVQFDNSSTAATDGKTITLPLTSKENSWIVRGYLDHEIGHVRLTDFGSIPKKTALHKSLWNILEDIRIETKMAEIYPGMATNYRKLVTELRAKEPGIFKVNPGDNPAGIICGYLVLLLRTRHLKQTALEGLAQKADRVFLDTFGPELKKDMLDIVLPYSKVHSSEDVLDMVETLVNLLVKYLQKQGKPQSDTTREQDSKPEPESPDSQDTSNCENPGSTKHQNSEQSPERSENSDKDNVPSEADIARAVHEALNARDEEQDMGTQLKNLALKKEDRDKIDRAVAVSAQEKIIRDFGYKEQEIKAPTQSVSKLSANLRGLLQAQVLDHSRPGLSGNRIARNQLHKIRTGEPRLFLRRSFVKQVNTAVHILVDNSSSMRNCQRFKTARIAALALIKALLCIRGVNVGLSIFPAVYPYHLCAKDDQIPVAEILKHGRRPGKNLLYPSRPKGSTPLAPSLRFAASKLYVLAEPRKTLLIITDGDPDRISDTEEAIREAMDLGIQVVCLGIEDVAHPDIFPHSEMVKDVKDLPHKAFNLFEQLLTAQP